VILTGYAHPEYAYSLAEFGNPRELPRCGGWILERQIPGSPLKDGMGCYPLFACHDWSKLHEDLNDLEADLISIVLVTDPFGDYDLAYLQRCFDFAKPFKEHFVADLRRPLKKIISKHHRYYAKKAKEHVKVEIYTDARNYLEEWVQLYMTLVKRHAITGIRAFSHDCFSRQLSVPGIAFFRGLSQGITLGANLIYVQQQVAYTHLSAFSAEGYNLRAAYAIRLAAIEYLRANGVIWLDLGGGAGLRTEDQDGLIRFKKGWATDTRTAYFCGRIFNKAKYTEIVRSKGISDTDYFPAYRKGEFT
jgi:hypothetical protein